MNSSQSILEIDLKIIKSNYLSLRDICLGAEVGASVKANSYGLGVKYIAPMLQKNGCKHFFVSSCSEGVELRQILDKNYTTNIYVLHGVFLDELEYFAEYNLTPVLNYMKQVYIWQTFAAQLNQILDCVLHVDTGMHRLGMEESEALLLSSQSFQGLNLLFVMSHLASAEEKNNTYNEIQFSRFQQYIQLFKAQFNDIRFSLANSSGIFLDNKYHFDITRPGAALYGINHASYTNDTKNIVIQNPIKLFAPIIQIHSLMPGESVGYNSTYSNNTNHIHHIATIAIGYRDGILRMLSNVGSVYIDDIKVPIVGRVSMDLMVIDITNIPYPSKQYIGKMVEIMGNSCTPDEISKICSTNGYEILSMLGERYKKIYN